MRNVLLYFFLVMSSIAAATMYKMRNCGAAVFNRFNVWESICKSLANFDGFIPKRLIHTAKYLAHLARNLASLFVWRLCDTDFQPVRRVAHIL